MKNESDRRSKAVFAGLLSAFAGLLAVVAACLHPVASALKISETSLFTAILVCEALLLCGMVVVSRRAHRRPRRLRVRS